MQHVIKESKWRLVCLFVCLFLWGHLQSWSRFGLISISRFELTTQCFTIFGSLGQAQTLEIEQERDIYVKLTHPETFICLFQGQESMWAMRPTLVPLPDNRNRICRVFLLSQLYYKTGTMGRIGSTKLVLPKWHKYGTLNRVIRVSHELSLCY